MYFTDDRTAAILALQEYLQMISKSAVYPSGVYDEKTQNAVKAFQKERGFEPDGVADYDTYTAIYEEYLTASRAAAGEHLWDSGLALPISEGDYGDGIAYLNDLISELAYGYGLRHSVRRGGRFSRGSADAVQELRHILGLREGRHVDGELYLRMRDERRNIIPSREI